MSERDVMQQALETITLVLKQMEYAVQGPARVSLAMRCNETSDALRNELAKPAAVPDGWVMVPKEPTLEMIGAAADEADCMGDWWRAMLAAAPQPPAPAVDVEAVQNGWSVKKKDDQYFVSESRHGDLLRGAWVDSDSVLKLYFDAHNHLGGPNKKVDVEAVREVAGYLNECNFPASHRPYLRALAKKLARAIGDEK